MSEEPPLFGHTILVTRPAHQAQKLSQMIENAGGNVLRCPAIEILPPKDADQARDQLKQLKDFDIAIFVSINAVESALALLAPVKLPQKLLLAAVGISTAESLAEHGYPNVIHPEHQFTSEGLLQTEELREIAGKKVAIVRGESGRQWLFKQLEKGGANVVSMAVYRRKLPADSKKILQQALQNYEITIISTTSNEGLSNMVEMSGKFRHRLLKLPLVVLSERSKNCARELGFSNQIAIAEKASNKAMVKTMIRLAKVREYR